MLTCESALPYDPRVNRRRGGHWAAPYASSPMAVTIAVANQKGGVGKTTTTSNLATALARGGLRILVVDVDPQGNLTSSFGVDRTAEQSLAEALLNRNIELPRYRVEDPSEAAVDVVPGTPELATVEVALQSKLGRELRLQEHLTKIKPDYDFILIDTPPSLGILTLNALVAADWVIIPTEARFFSLQGLQMLHESIEEVTYLNPSLKILGIVLSKFDRRLREEKTVAEFLRERWGARVFGADIPTNSKILESTSAGVSIFAHDLSDRGVKRAIAAYEALASEVVARAA